MPTMATALVSNTLSEVKDEKRLQKKVAQLTKASLPASISRALESPAWRPIPAWTSRLVAVLSTYVPLFVARSNTLSNNLLPARTPHRHPRAHLPRDMYSRCTTGCGGEGSHMDQELNRAGGEVSTRAT